VLGDQITLRRVTEFDDDLLFRWRNEPSTRSMFFSQEEVCWTDHVRWLDCALADTSETLLIGQCRDIPIGVVRFSRGPGGVTVSLTVNPECRNKGYGRKLLEEGISAFRATDHHAVFLAAIKLENLASLKVFEACGFVEDRRDDAAVWLACHAPPAR